MDFEIFYIKFEKKITQMKRILTTFTIVGIFIFTNAQVITPQASSKANFEETVGLTEIEVEYFRPNKNDRKIFGNLVPYDKIWRTGANNNTTIAFKDDVKIDGQALKAGKYSIYTKPNKDNWEIYFYTESSNWGNPTNWDESKIAAKTSAKVQNLNHPVETFTIALENKTMNTADLTIAWDNVKVSTKIEVPTEEKVMESIKKTMSGQPTAQDYMAAANYFYRADKDISQAKKWMDEGMKLNKDPQFYQLYSQALIHEKAGNKDSAIKIAQESLEASKKAGNSDYIKLNEDLIKRLK